MRYLVVTGTTIGILLERVQKFLDEGWVLQGGVAVDSDGDYLQAVSKMRQSHERMSVHKADDEA